MFCGTFKTGQVFVNRSSFVDANVRALMEFLG